jgi:hypothetical protein
MKKITTQNKEAINDKRRYKNLTPVGMLEAGKKHNCMCVHPT